MMFDVLIHVSSILIQTGSIRPQSFMTIYRRNFKFKKILSTNLLSAEFEKTKNPTFIAGISIPLSETQVC